ncbi:phosphatidylinositol N-acetylglucosaminyltransferase subunit H [Agrilus planipennis]|uniref:Phosphatidylinositol N-acetylglucosaminyltransferase subunit H n=1 Tax=Agrilus planipennis TaxID=224129 RepID=A0A1W4WR15_AGRPL|nr:phosphatidylinositol N-acetylglucosaminyltransferase subunit H [Agrilus planipennis]
MTRSLKVFENLNRKNIIVETFQCKKRVLKVIVRDKSVYRHRKKITILTAIAILNLYCYHKETLDLFTCAVIQFIVLYFNCKIFFRVQKETLLVIKSLGIQLESHSMLRTSTLFIPWVDVKDVVINEVISMQRVLYMLIIITKTPIKSIKGKQIIPLFYEFSPRLACLEFIYSRIEALREC